jgi:glutaminyl-tRNA synthetase
MKHQTHTRRKNFWIYESNSLVITAYVEPSLNLVLKLGSISVSAFGYFAVDKDATTSKLVFNKTVGLKDAWEEKVKDTNSINNA